MHGELQLVNIVSSLMHILMLLTFLFSLQYANATTSYVAMGPTSYKAQGLISFETEGLTSYEA